jgi:hypothetical protein
MEGYFVLDDRGEPIQEPDLQVWTRWFERADRSVRRSVVAADVTVLTTFLGIGETSPAGEAPALFQTRVFGGVLDGEETWSRTRAEAVIGHDNLAEWSRVGNLPDHGISGEDLR